MGTLCRYQTQLLYATPFLLLALFVLIRQQPFSLTSPAEPNARDEGRAIDAPPSEKPSRGRIPQREKARPNQVNLGPKSEPERHPVKVLVKNTTTGQWVDTGHRVSRGCRVPQRAKTYSQTNEDRALHARYFSRPTICHGTFLEIGALDGVKYSNTKFFEDSMGWSGVLIEAQTKNFVNLKRNRPKAKNFGEAVCPHGQNFVEFVDGNGAAVGGVGSEMTQNHKLHWLKKNPTTYKVPCRPIGEMIREAGVKAIDFFILDVEGAELMVLETMDWTIPVKVFVVEMGRTKERDQQVRNMLLKHGYTKPQWSIKDFCASGGPCANNEVFENLNYRYDA